MSGRFEGHSVVQAVDEMLNRLVAAVAREADVRVRVGVIARLLTQLVHREPATLVQGQRAAGPFDEKLTERVARIGIT